jgi:hypothetical protein
VSREVERSGPGRQGATVTQSPPWGRGVVDWGCDGGVVKTMKTDEGEVDHGQGWDLNEGVKALVLPAVSSSRLET